MLVFLNEQNLWQVLQFVPVILIHDLYFGKTHRTNMWKH